MKAITIIILIISPCLRALEWGYLEGPYKGNDDYLCTGRHYNELQIGTQDLKDIIGQNCKKIGDKKSISISSEQGWDCDNIHTYYDIECLAIN